MSVTMKTTKIKDGVTEEEKMEHVSITKGYWFYFQDGENEIAVFGSGWSGKEIVYFNDDPVSEDRNIRFKSTHEFTKNGKHYRIVYEVVSMMTGEVNCQLFIDDVLTDEQNKAVVVKKGKAGWGTILFMFLVGMAFGYTAVNLIMWLFG